MARQGSYIRYEEYERAYEALEQVKISEAKRDKIGLILLYSEELILKPPDVIALSKMSADRLDQVMRRYKEKYMRKMKPRLISY